MLRTYTSKAYNNSQDAFQTMIGFVALGHVLFIDNKKGGQRRKSHSCLREHPISCLCMYARMYLNYHVASYVTKVCSYITYELDKNRHNQKYPLNQY